MTNHPIDGDKIFYAVERFRGHSDTLAAKLELFGVRLKRFDHHRPCIEYVDEDGSVMREIGEVVAIDTGPRAGQVHVWPYTDADEEERIILLRTAEKVVHGELAADWYSRRTPNGVDTRRSVISVEIQEGAGRALRQGAVTALPAGVWETRSACPEDVLA